MQYPWAVLVNVLSVFAGVSNGAALRSPAKQIVFIISGSDEFGGHANQWFHGPIRDAIALTSQYFKRGRAEFGVLWTVPTANAPTHRIVSQMQSSTTVLRDEVNAWLNSDAIMTKPSRWTGLRGSLEFAQQHLFSKASADKIVITLTHMNIMPQEIGLFLTQNCTKMLVNVIVFPWPWLDCAVREMQSVLRIFNGKLGWTGYYTHDLAFCGRQQHTIRQLGRIIDTEIPNMHSSIDHFCPTPPPLPTTPFNWTAWEIMMRANATNATTTPASTLPTQLVLVREIPQDCHAIWCKPWLKRFYFFENLLIFTIVGLVILCICCSFVMRSPAKMEYSLEMGLKMHSRYFYPQCRRIGLEMPVAKKMKRSKSKGSIASRKSVAKMKGKKERDEEKQKKKEEVQAKMGSSFGEEDDTKSVMSKASRRSKLREPPIMFPSAHVDKMGAVIEDPKTVAKPVEVVAKPVQTVEEVKNANEVEKQNEKPKAKRLSIAAMRKKFQDEYDKRSHVSTTSAPAPFFRPSSPIPALLQRPLSHPDVQPRTLNDQFLSELQAKGLDPRLTDELKKKSAAKHSCPRISRTGLIQAKADERKKEANRVHDGNKREDKKTRRASKESSKSKLSTMSKLSTNAKKEKEAKQAAAKKEREVKEAAAKKEAATKKEKEAKEAAARKEKEAAAKKEKEAKEAAAKKQKEIKETATAAAKSAAAAVATAAAAAKKEAEMKRALVESAEALNEVEMYRVDRNGNRTPRSSRSDSAYGSAGQRGSYQRLRAQQYGNSTASSPRRPGLSDVDGVQSMPSTPLRTLSNRDLIYGRQQRFSIRSDPELRRQRQLWLP